MQEQAHSQLKPVVGQQKLNPNTRTLADRAYVQASQRGDPAASEAGALARSPSGALHFCGRALRLEALDVSIDEV